jgi:ATP-binding cassette subfamily B multidrug efflux pump
MNRNESDGKLSAAGPAGAGGTLNGSAGSGRPTDGPGGAVSFGGASAGPSSPVSSSAGAARTNGAPQHARPGFGRRGPGGRHGPIGMMPGEKARDFSGTMKKLLAALGRYRIAILVVLLIAAASTVFSIFGPKVLGTATTTLFEGVMARAAGTGGVDFAAIGRIVLTVLALYLASAAASYVQGWIMAGISVKLTYRFRREISEKIERMPLSYFDGTSHGEVLSRITNDVDTVSRTLNQSLSQIVTSAVTFIGVIVMMLSISAIMTAVAFATVPLSALAVMVVVKRSQGHFKRQQEYLGHLNGHVEEMYGGHAVIEAYNGRERSVRRFEELNRTLYDSGWKSHFISGLMMPAMTFIGNLGYVAVSLAGGWLALRGAVTVGNIQAFIQYVRSFGQPIQQLANISNVLQQTAAAAERVFEFLEFGELPPDPAEPHEPGTVTGRVEFRNVRFGYTPDKIVIDGFSAVAEPGRKIAIVGPTGAGKTTLVKLLMRFYDVSGGEILIDGHDIRTFRRASLRRLFGMVLQDTWLFNGTIMENIRYGREGASDEEVIEAAKTAQADHFIRTLPSGYRMVINEEASNISQGQMQLLTIARAVLADPPMLILDEATSNVDTRTETLIQRAMDALMQGRTSFIIAHRLSTIRNADLILVMRDGAIVEQGTHEELLAKGGFYAELYASQFETVRTE